jgi:hypothetical protein
MRIELTDEQSARVIAAFIDRFLVPNEACGSPAIPQPDLSPELRDILAELMSRQSGIFATLNEVQSSVSFLGDRQVDSLGQFSYFQSQLQKLGDIMATFPEIIEGQRTNNALVVEALTGVQTLIARQDSLLEGKPTAAQLQELRSLQNTQAETLAKVIDTVKQTDVTTPSPTEPTPVTPPDTTAPDATAPDVTAPDATAPVTPEPAPEIPATPDPIVVQPSPVDVGLDGAVSIDAPESNTPGFPVVVPGLDTTPPTNPDAPAPLF